MPMLDKGLWLLMLLGLVIAILVACQPQETLTAGQSEAADVEELPTAEIIMADEVKETLIAAATHTARDVARTGHEMPTPHPTAEEQSLADLLPNLGQAPELTNEEWINSEPLRLSDLRGKVVLVEFWTFG